MRTPAVAALWGGENGPVEALRTDAPLAVRVEGSFASAAAAWRELEAKSGVSPYGRLAWAEAWQTTIGWAEGVEPCIVIGSDRDGIAVLLPLGIRNWGPWRIASFLGGKDSNGNLGLFADPGTWTAQSIRALLDATGEKAGVDLFTLRTQPANWTVDSNPLLLLPCQPSPSDGRSGALMAGAEATLKVRLSKHARKQLRQKENRLRAERPLEHRVAATPDEIDATVAAYFRMRGERAKETGTPPPHPALAEFLRAGARQRDGAAPALELHALHWGAEIIAVLGGATGRGRFSGMVIAFDSRRTVARNSPGDLVVAATAADLGRRGFTRFDLGIGDARYKAAFCDTPEPMFDSFIGRTTAGRGLAVALSLASLAKRRIKRSRRLWPAASQLRAAWAQLSRW